MEESFWDEKQDEIDPKVPGRIHKEEFRRFWVEELQAADMHLTILEEGYKLPFSSLPPQSSLPNNYSARQPEHYEFVCRAVDNHLTVGAISEVSEPPYLIMPLQVIAPIGRKKRLITDPSRQLNPYLHKQAVKLDNLHHIVGSIQKDAWFGVMDLASGYYHIKVHEPHRKYLGFSWTGKDQILRYYVWNIAFLGLAPLVRTFTKLQKPIIAYLRQQGIQCYIYIDDLIVFGESRQECQRNMELTRKAWKQAGWVEKHSKARGPMQQGEYLGLVLNTVTLSIHVPQHKKNLIVTLCKNLARQSVWHIKDIAQVYGKILANLLAVGPQLLLLTRQGLKTLASTDSWSQRITIDHLHQELEFLAKNFMDIDGYPMEQEHRKVSTSLVQTASDASAQAVAVVQLICNQGITHSTHEGRCGFKLAVQPFTDQEKSLSSTWRELLGLLVLLRTQSLSISGTAVIHWTDSKNVERIMLKGSNTDNLQRLAMTIYKAARELRIDLRVIWRPRSDPRIQLADDFSRAVDAEDYGVDDGTFRYLEHLTGRAFTFDLFASDNNFRVSKFASILASDLALFRDAFTHVWTDLGFCYVHPPVSSIGAVIRKIVQDKACGVLILPLWRTMKDWLLVCNDGVHFNRVITRGTAIWPYYRKGPDVISSTFRGFSKFATLALEFDGNQNNPLSSRVERTVCSKNGCHKCLPSLF